MRLMNTRTSEFCRLDGRTDLYPIVQRYSGKRGKGRIAGVCIEGVQGGGFRLTRGGRGLTLTTKELQNVHFTAVAGC